MLQSTEAALALCREFGIQIPQESPEATVQAHRRRRGKESDASCQQRLQPFAASAEFDGPHAGYL